MSPLYASLFLSSLILLGFASAQDPTPIPVIGSWSYAGCAQETGMGRTLDGASFAGNVTAELCLDFCRTQDFPFAGMEYSHECFCGMELKHGATLNNTGCNMPCSGDPSQVCGGANRLTVYEDEEYSGPEFVQSVGSYELLGCSTEGKSERALSGYAFANANMTVAQCTAACSARDFVLAGLEYSTECYCGNVVSNQTAIANLEDCQMKCGGNKKTYCGGPDRVLIYTQLNTTRGINGRHRRRTAKLI